MERQRHTNRDRDRRVGNEGEERQIQKKDKTN